MTTKQTQIAIGIAALVALAGTAIASSYYTRESLAPEPQPVAAVAPPPVHHAKHPQQVANTQQRPACDDHNIVGTVGGAVAGGLVGSAFGKGNGRGLATSPIGSSNGLLTTRKAKPSTTSAWSSRTSRLYLFTTR